MSVADNVKRIRKERKLTQQELAKRAGISQQTISFLESERNTPTQSTLRLLASALGCTVAELMGETGEHVSGDHLTPAEREILSVFRELNDAGQMVAVRQIRSLLEEKTLRKKDGTATAM